MPIYEYVCEKCGSRIEVMQKLSDEPLKRCRSCRGKLEKVISRASFQLKGSGWYLTDYSRGGASSESKDKTDKAESKTDKAESKKSSKSSSEGSTGGSTGSSSE